VTIHPFKIPLLILFTFVLSSFQTPPKAIVNKTEAQEAFQYLNEIRTNPEKFQDKFTFLSRQPVTRTKLVWNETLAKVAETKALDMANRNYFAHVDPDGYGINHFIHKAGYKLNKDWLGNKSDNNFESLAYGLQNGKAAITCLIIDHGEPTLGHRKHLLGIGEWNDSLVDIGIGFVTIDRNEGYLNTYICVIIAKHDW